MNSFHSGPIFPDALGQDLSRNVGLMSIYAFQKNLYWRIGPDMMPKNGQNFRKSDASEAESEFWRPCRGLSPFQGYAPKSETLYMIRGAFLALRVTPKHGKSSVNMGVKKV